jgi:TolB-like protein
MFIILFFIILYFVPYTYAAEKISMAVYEFDAAGVPPALGNAVADFIQAGLYETGRFNIIERKKIQQILKEQGFQKTGVTTTEQAVEVGRILNVNNIVIGTVAKIGKRIVITMQLIDVEMAKIILTDKVECDSEDLLTTAAKKLAEHFSKGVSIKGKVLKILNDNEVIINLGMQDNVEKGQELTVERLGEAIKDETGRIVYQERKKIAIVKIDNVLEEASKAKVLRKYEPINEGDIVEITKEKLKPLEPILKGEETGETLSKEEGEVYVGLFVSYEGASDFFIERKNTSTGDILFSKSKFGTVGPYWSFGMSICGNLFTKDTKWLADIYSFFGFSSVVLKNMNNVELTNYYLYLMPISMGVRFYPFTTLLNPDYKKYKSAREQRGAFAPYLSIGGNFYIGLFNPNTSSEYSVPSFVFGGGLDARAGIELFNTIFFEFIYRFVSSAYSQVDELDKYGSKTGIADNYEFKLNTFSINFGLKF